MDRTVPLAAARMLDFVRATEVGTDGPSGYNVIFGFNQDKLPKRLAMEWASFPVLASVRGQHRQLARGQSYYTGDPLNKALVSPEEFERVIDEMKELGDAMPAPAPVPLPKPEVTITKEPTMPAPVGHNGGPPLNSDLSPVDATNKANKGAGGAAIGSGGIGAGIVYLWSLTSWFPTEWAADPQALIVLTGIFASVFGGVSAWIGAYRATDRRFMDETS